MKKYINYICLSSCFIICGCIIEFSPKGIDETSDILVVEGLITDYESIITLSRSSHLTDERWSGWSLSSYVLDAEVYIEECDDSNVINEWRANIDIQSLPPRYTIENGKLDPNSRYRLRIEIEETEETNIYFSELSYPIITPEIDSIFWMKRPGHQVMIYVASQSHNNENMYYCRSFREDWEIQSLFYIEDYPFYCWNYLINNELLLFSNERTVSGQSVGIITNIDPTHRKLSTLYRITVKQNALSKRAYDYFSNIKKNVVQTSGIFAPIPSELRGNIFCENDPNIPVIGFVEVSTTTQNHKFIAQSDGAYEEIIRSACIPILESDLVEYYGEVPRNYVLLPDPPELDAPPPHYVQIQCVDCTFFGTEDVPDDWPYNL